jgi:1-acyl-sn-glycerol-3-phosphate acyltransferase
MKFICSFILFKILRWKIEGAFPTDLKKYLIIVAPHTHWNDFTISILIKYAIGLKSHFIGKATLFKPPFGFILRALGGNPVDRTKSTNFVDSIVAMYNDHDEFIISLSPEGTRKKVDEWKTGFYYIAKGAKVPIVCAALDYEHKKMKIRKKVFYLSGDTDADILELGSFFEGIKGKVPEYS